MNRIAVIDLVALTEGQLGPATPRLTEFARGGKLAAITPSFPAVTCTAQANYLTGQSPTRHGIVGNGWYNRELAEVHFWKQSNHLMAGPKLWDGLRQKDPNFTCAQLFWWFNMYAKVDYSITPRPIYPADGRKVFDIYSWPYEIRPRIKKALGEFPFPAFWGPAAGADAFPGGAAAASQWIAKSAMWVENEYHPTLSLVYLPHLDYNAQRFGPAHWQSPQSNDLATIDAIAGDLISFYQERGVGVVVLSEYGISPVNTPVALNRLFRQKGWLAVKEELGLEMLDCGASKVFAVVDHQVAHVYLNDPSLESTARAALENQPGVEVVLGAAEKRSLGLDHARAGDLVVVGRENAWFNYYYWLEDARAPDFARTVDIHRKPGYDPVELFLDPRLPSPKLKILWRLLQKRMGFRMLMDVVPLDASLVKGSHGRRVTTPGSRPVFICQSRDLDLPAQIESTEVRGFIEALVTGA